MDIAKLLKELAKKARKEIKKGLSPCLSRQEVEVYVEGGERMPSQLRELATKHQLGCEKCSNRINKEIRRSMLVVSIREGVVSAGKTAEVFDNGEEVEVIFPPVGKYITAISISKSRDKISGLVSLIWPEGEDEILRVREAAVSVKLKADTDIHPRIEVGEILTENGEFSFDVQIGEDSEYYLVIGSIPVTRIIISNFVVPDDE